MRNILRKITVAFVGAFAVLLVSQKAFATSSEMKQMEKFVADADKQAPEKITPLPTFPEPPPHEYAASALRSPFVPSMKITPGAANQPDMNRKKEPLEAFTLDSLHMVGTLSKGKQTWALISAPGGVIYRVQKGNYLGKDYGKVMAVDKDKVQIQETVPDGGGGWKQRDTTLSFSKS